MAVGQPSLIDWRAPWMAPWHLLGAEVLPDGLLEEGVELAPRLNTLAAAPVRFVPQSALPGGEAYESFIFSTGTVPTRNNLHDLFNALCWMRFPQTKRSLNRWQAEAIEAAGGVQPTRGSLRDALTLFDENALLLQAPASLWQALRARDWMHLLVHQREVWSQATAVTFGHALTEKLVQPYKSITAHVLCLPVPPELPIDLGQGVHPWDEWLAAQLTPQGLATKPFTPLPVLGIPGWWPDNADPVFYADTQVFRPPAPPL